MSFPDFPGRVFEAPELSDGTLRFLALAGALLAYRLPPFIALNEPESSLHPDLMEPLAQLVVQAARRTQIWLVTHSERLANAIAATGEGRVRVVIKREGATWIEGLSRASANSSTTIRPRPQSATLVPTQAESVLRGRVGRGRVRRRLRWRG